MTVNELIVYVDTHNRMAKDEQKQAEELERKRRSRR